MKLPGYQLDWASHVCTEPVKSNSNVLILYNHIYAIAIITDPNVFGILLFNTNLRKLNFRNFLLELNCQEHEPLSRIDKKKKKSFNHFSFQNSYENMTSNNFLIKLT